MTDSRHRAWFTDAEFAAAFVDASLVDDIISAARSLCAWAEFPEDDGCVRALDCLIDALSAFDAAAHHTLDESCWCRPTVETVP